MRRLPFVLLNIHVQMIAFSIKIRANVTKPETVNGAYAPAMRNKGKCHRAWSVPSTRLPRNAPYCCCNRGKANPRQPGSSPNGPPRMSVKISTFGRYEVKIRGQCWMRPFSGVPPNKTLALNKRTMGAPKSTRRYHWTPTRHCTYRRSSCHTPAIPYVTAVTMKADSVGPVKGISTKNGRNGSV